WRPAGGSSISWWRAASGRHPPGVAPCRPEVPPARGRAPSGRTAAPAQGPAESPTHDVAHLVDVLVCFAPFGGRPDTALDVILEDHDRQRVHGRPQRGGLLEDVDAVLLALDHPGDAADLAFHPGERPDEPRLVLRIGVAEVIRCRVGRRATLGLCHARPPCRDVVVADLPASRDMIPPGSIDRVSNYRRRGRRPGSRLSADGSARAHATVRERRRLRRLWPERPPRAHPDPRTP